MNVEENTELLIVTAMRTANPTPALKIYGCNSYASACASQIRQCVY